MTYASRLSGESDVVGSARTAARLLLIFAAFYFVQLATFTPSIDEEFAAVDPNPWVFVARGRWGQYLFTRFLMPQPVVPFLPVAFLGCCLAAGYILLLRAHDVSQPRIVDYVLFPLFAAFPTWYFLVEFAHVIAPTGVAIVLACGTALCVRETVERSAAGWREFAKARVLKRLALQVVLGAVAMGMYPPHLFTLAVLGGSVVITRALGDGSPPRAILRHVALFACVLAATLLLYGAITFGFSTQSAVQDGYVAAHVHLGDLAHDPLLQLKITWYQAWRVYSGHDAVYGTAATSFGLVVLVGLIAIAAKRPSTSGRRLVLMAIAVAVLGTPFLMHPLSHGFIPYRTLVAVPSVMWLFARIGMTSDSRLVAKSAAVVVAFAIFQILYVTGLFNAANALVYQHDRDLAAAIHERIVAAQPGVATGPYRTDFYGAKQFSTVYPRIPSSTIGFSFFEWDGGNPTRIRHFMRLVGFDDLADVSNEERRSLLPTFSTMAVWPAAGSVRIVGDVALVKLGAEPDPAHRP